MVDSFLIVMPELIVTGASLILMLVAAWVGDRSGPALTWLGVLALAVAAFFVPGIRDSGGVAFDGLFIGDSFAAFSKIVIYIGAAVSMLAAMSWFGRDRDFRAEYPVLILFSVIGMGMMVSAGDLLTLYIGLELQNLCAYVLASFQRKDTRSAEAGLKYFVLGALASGILLYGISLLYGFTGTTQFGSDFGVTTLSQDGYTSGRLTGFDIAADGMVLGRYSNGQANTLGQQLSSVGPNWAAQVSTPSTASAARPLSRLRWATTTPGPLTTSSSRNADEPCVRKPTTNSSPGTPSTSTRNIRPSPSTR